MNIDSRRVLGLLIVVGEAYSASVALAMHWLEPEFDPIRAPVSAYALGRYGVWMTTTYFAMGVALLAAGIGLMRTLPATRLATAAFSFTLIGAAGVFVAGLFPMDFPPPLRTSSGRLHALGGLLAFPGTVVATLLFSFSLRGSEHWHMRSGRALFLSGAMAATFAFGVGSFALLGFAAYAQRVFIALRVAWMMLVGLHLIRSGQWRAAPSRPSRARR
jgi:hypothetical protein